MGRRGGAGLDSLLLQGSSLQVQEEEEEVLKLTNKPAETVLL